MAADGAARRELLARMRDVLKAVRLFKNHRALELLATIEDIGGCHSKDLVAQTALDPSTISRAVAALVRNGMVQRAADQHDGRASVLALTPRGRKFLDEATDERLADALRDWTVTELTALAAMLHRLADDLNKTDESNKTNHTLEAAR